MNNGWRVRLTEKTATPHVVPVADTRRHLPENCWCQPTFDGKVLVHHSADRREEREPDYKRPLS
jgi:hypothetical protein